MCVSPDDTPTTHIHTPTFCAAQPILTKPKRSVCVCVRERIRLHRHGSWFKTASMVPKKRDDTPKIKGQSGMSELGTPLHLGGARMAASESLQCVWSVTVSKVLLPRILHGGVAQKMSHRHTGGGHFSRWDDDKSCGQRTKYKKRLPRRSNKNKNKNKNKNNNIQEKHC